MAEIEINVMSGLCLDHRIAAKKL